MPLTTPNLTGDYNHQGVTSGLPQDGSGNGNHSPAFSSTPPTYSADGLVYPVGSVWYSLPMSVANAKTIHILLKPTAACYGPTGLGLYGVVSNSAGGAGWNLVLSTVNYPTGFALPCPYVYANGTNYDAAFDPLTPDGFNVLTIVRTNTVDAMYINGIAISPANAMSPTISIGNTGTIRIGGGGYIDNAFAGTIASVVVYNESQTPTDVLTNATYMKSRYIAAGGTVPFVSPYTGNILFGAIDSLMLGVNATDAAHGQFDLTRAGTTRTWGRYYNLAISGQTVRDTNIVGSGSRLPKIIDRLHSPTASRVMTLWQGGTNDGFFTTAPALSASSVATAVAAEALSQVQYITGKGSNSYAVILPMSSRGGNDQFGSFSLDAYKTLLNANYAANAWGPRTRYIDASTLPAMTANNAYADTSKFDPDTIHWINAGHALYAAQEILAVNALESSFAPLAYYYHQRRRAS